MVNAPSAPAGTTSESAGPRTPPPKRVLALGAAVVLIAAGATTAVLLGGGGESEEKAPIFVPHTRQIYYEITGAGSAESIQYVVGAGNKAKEVQAPKLPWKIEVPLEIGLSGGSVQVTAANAAVAPLTCLIKIDGKVAFTATGVDESDVACSSAIPPATADQK